MEFIITYIVIAVLLSMLTGSLFFIVFSVLSIYVMFFFVLDIWFLYIITKLFRTKPVTGEFSRVDTVKDNPSKAAKKLKYKVAVYSVDGKEYESVFPAEGLFGVYFYKKGRQKLRLYSKEGFIFDNYNLLSCVIWPAFSTFSWIFGFYFMVLMIQYSGLLR